MMFKNLLTGLILVAAVETAGAQSAPTSTPSTAPPAKRPITLVGCVQTDPAKPEWFTLLDANTGTTYRLNGTNVKAYVWRNVRIVGGLVPSPNIAAQAGAIDSTKAAMVSQGDNPPSAGSIGVPELRVIRVRRLTGSCAPKTDR